jgi:hypothetical protein
LLVDGVHDEGDFSFHHFLFHLLLRSKLGDIILAQKQVSWVDGESDTTESSTISDEESGDARVGSSSYDESERDVS